MDVDKTWMSYKFNNTDNTEFSNDVLKIVSHYDYVERTYGFFKYQQENTHKSNIYSVKLKNSGLNPQNDLTITYFDYFQVIEKLKSKEIPSINNDYTGNGTRK